MADDFQCSNMVVAWAWRPPRLRHLLPRNPAHNSVNELEKAKSAQ